MRSFSDCVFVEQFLAQNFGEILPTILAYFDRKVISLLVIHIACPKSFVKTNC